VVNLLRTDGDPHVGQVSSNDASGMAQIVEHLHGLGHQRIGLVAGPPSISTALARLRGYRNALLENGFNVDNDLVVTIDHIDTEQGRRAAAQLLDRTDVTAIIGFNDMVTFGVLQELRARSLVCPRDVSVVGYSDVPAAELVAPALTTVAVDHYKMGVEAARMMLELLDKPDDFVARTIELPVHLVVRETTAAASTRAAETS